MNSAAPTPQAPPYDWERALRLIVLDRAAGGVLHMQVRHGLRQLIQNLPPHVNRLMPENEMGPILSVSQGTVRKALDGLVVEGLIKRRRALGTMIKDRTGSAWLKNLAVIMPNYPSHTTSAHLAALNRQMGLRGGKMSIIPLNRGDDWRSCRERLDFRPSEGGVVFLSNIPGTTVMGLNAALQHEGYRSVHLGRTPEGCVCNSVRADNQAFVRTGLQKLTERGHRRIAFIVAEPEENRDVQTRVSCFEKAAADLCLPQAEVVHCGMHSWESSAQAAGEAIDILFGRHEREHPTALFTISDSTAMGAYTRLASRGILVPRDVSLLSYDGTEITRMVTPRLDSLVVSVDKFAQAIVALLVDRTAIHREVLIAPDFQEGGSIAPPPGA